MTQESDHYVPAQFSCDFFKKFDLTMKLKQDELKVQKNNRQVNEITENNFIKAFGVTEDQMDKAGSNAKRERKHRNFGKFVSLTSKDQQN